MMQNLTSKEFNISEEIFQRKFFAKKPVEILSLARKFLKIEKAFSETHSELLNKKIAILGNANHDYFAMVFRIYCYAIGIKPNIYLNPFGSMTSEILDESSGIYKFSPEIILFLLNYRDIRNYPQLLSPESDVTLLAERNIDELNALFEKVCSRCGAVGFAANIVAPNRHVLGNLEATTLSDRGAFLHYQNQLWHQRKPAWLGMINQDAIAADFGKNGWFDDSAWFISKQPFSLEAIPSLALPVARVIAAAAGKPKKCLILDLDNTLWGGVIGDDGLHGIRLQPNDPIGEAFLAFQEYLLLLKERGVLLAVCSKNDAKTAEEVFLKHEHIRLKMDDFAAFYANWQPKPDNIRQIALDINIGLDSCVFFDDNPAEQALVRMQLPMVEVVDVPEDPSDFCVALDRLYCFEWLQLSAEDLARPATYQADSKRKALGLQYEDYQSYLTALEMSAEIKAPSEEEIARFVQLINKTNQFNLRTARHSESEIGDMRNNLDYILLRVSLTDKFSQYGIISSIILRKIGNDLFIETWVMSCRVFKRELEFLAMNRIFELAKAFNCRRVTGEFVPTQRNKACADFFEQSGFIQEETPMNYSGCVGKFYAQNTQDYQPILTRIRMTHEDD